MTHIHPRSAAFVLLEHETDCDAVLTLYAAHRYAIYSNLLNRQITLGDLQAFDAAADGIARGTFKRVL